MVFLKGASIRAAFGAVILLIVSSVNVTGLSSWNDSGNDLYSGEASHVEVNNGAVDLASASNNWTRMDIGTPRAYHLGGIYPDMVYDSKAGVFIYCEFLYEYLDKTWTYNPSNNQWIKKNGTMNCFTYFSMAYDNRDDIVVTYSETATYVYNLTSDCWTAMYPYPYPDLSYGRSMAYDSVHDEMVLFGGFEDETWTYNLSNNHWKKMNPGTSPPVSTFNDIVFDAAAGECVVFAGTAGETWMYDLPNDTWTNRSPANSPPARNGYSIAYDESIGGVILYGGFYGANCYNDTWWYNATDNTWTNKTPIDSPEPRNRQRMAYDSQNKRTVMFGGINDTAIFNDIWSYDSANNTWSNKIACMMPQGRVGHSMVSDDNLGSILLFGGRTGEGTRENDVWLLDVNQKEWVNRNPSPAPMGRTEQAMVYDSKDGIFILFGGWSDEKHGCLNDTWSYDARTDTWTNLSPPDSPPGRFCHSMAYDSINDVVVLFGGNDGTKTLFGVNDSNKTLGDTWLYEYSSNTWVKKNPDPAPPPDDQSQMAYDTANGLAVLVSSPDTSIWTYNAGNNSWINRTTIPVRCAGTGNTMVYDEKKGFLVFGSWTGGYCIYNLSTGILGWTNVPSGIDDDFAIAYDKDTGTIVVFAGSNWQVQAGWGCISDDVWTSDVKEYFPSGIFTSRPFDTGGSAYFGDLHWDAVVPDGTGIRFQFRTADTPEHLNSTPFTGPDGTVNSFYITGDQQINAMNNGTRWMQYRAYLNTSSLNVIPVLKGVTINFNLIQSLQLDAPKGGNQWTGLQNITWTASDPDNDSLTFSIYLENASASILLASDLPNDTSSWSWNTSTVPSGTYRIRLVAKDDNPSIPLTVNATSGNFTVIHPPHVELLNPLNNSIVNTTSVRLSWIGTEPDGDPLNFTVEYSDRPLTEGNGMMNFTKMDHLDLANLTDNKTYFWTVHALDDRFDGVPVQSGIWTFTVKVPHPPVNHSPRITSLPPTQVMAGDELYYNITATDADSDVLAYSLVASPQNMSIDPASGRIQWMPSTDDVGNHTVIVQVSDGRGGVDDLMFTLDVLAQDVPPGCTITLPFDGLTVSGRIQICGTANNGTLPLTLIQIRIDGGNWTTAIGLENWTLTVNSGKMINGLHIIEARAFDGSLYSGTASVEFTVDNPKPSVTSGVNPFYLPAIIIVIVAGLGVLLVMRKRKRGPPAD